MPTPAERAFVGLGSNVGDRLATIRAAVEALARTPGIDVVRLSTIIETEPVGGVAEGTFLNGVVELRTTRTPRALLDAMLEIERRHGRDRSRERRWGSRTLDLDLLMHGSHQINEPGLVIPHPRLAERAFVLLPLAEIAPEAVVPGLGRSARDLLAALEIAGARTP